MDLISRQAALDAIEKYFEGLTIRGHYDMVQIVKDLDPVDLVRCGECRYKPTDTQAVTITDKT